MDRLAVAAGAPAQFGGIELAAARTIDDTQLQRTLAGQGHGDAAVCDTAGVIGRTVDRVDDPDELFFQVPEILLLAEEAAAGQQRGQSLRQEMLDREVRRGHKVGEAVFLGHAERLRNHQCRSLFHDIDYLLEHGNRV